MTNEFEQPCSICGYPEAQHGCDGECYPLFPNGEVFTEPKEPETPTAQQIANSLELRRSADKLIVTPHPDAGPEWLLVDASALVRDQHDVRFWSLVHDGEGQWLHPDSGERAALGEVLYGIASAYWGPGVEERSRG